MDFTTTHSVNVLNDSFSIKERPIELVEGSFFMLISPHILMHRHQMARLQF